MDKLGSEPSPYYYMQDMPSQITQPKEQDLLAPLCLIVPHLDTTAGAMSSTGVHCGRSPWATMPEEFWLYTFKVRRCKHARRHDWTACPFVHKGERMRRRDLRRFPYAAVFCPYFHPSIASGSGGYCPRGRHCGYAHGLCELWMHPAKFRTIMCNFGLRCTRRFCFFAHSAAELRHPDAAREGPLCGVPLHTRGGGAMDAMAGLGMCVVAATTDFGSPWDGKEEEVAVDYPHIELIVDLLN